MLTNSPEDRQLVRHLYQDRGLSHRAIGRELGCSHTTVRLFMARNAIPARRPVSDATPALALSKILDRCTENAAGCWVWGGAKSPKGYGCVRYQGRVQRTHRVVYLLMVGSIPDGLELDHLCGNEPCCNPQHLEPVTGALNLARAKAAAVT